MSLCPGDNCAEISKCTMTWRKIINNTHCLHSDGKNYFAIKLVTWNLDSNIPVIIPFENKIIGWFCPHQ